MNRIPLSLALATLVMFQSVRADARVVWQIGKADDSAAEFTLAPAQYKRFLEKDFGWEDRFFHVGTSAVDKDWPYVIPGPSDKWRGTWSTSGWRSHVLTVLFELESRPEKGNSL